MLSYMLLYGNHSSVNASIILNSELGVEVTFFFRLERCKPPGVSLQRRVGAARCHPSVALAAFKGFVFNPPRPLLACWFGVSRGLHSVPSTLLQCFDCCNYRCEHAVSTL